MLLVSRFHQCNVKNSPTCPKTILMLTQSLHSAGFPTASANINLAYSTAPANVTAVGTALSQYSEPHSHVELDAYDARSTHMTAPSLLPHLPVNTVEELNNGITEMKRKRLRKNHNRGPDRGVRKKAVRSVKKVDRTSEQKLLPRPEQRESLPSPPGRRTLPHPEASLPAASGFGGPAVGFGGGPWQADYNMGHEQLTSGLEAESPQAGCYMGQEQFAAAPEQGPGYAESNWGFGGSVAQPEQAQGYYNQQPGQNFRQAEQRYPQTGRYDQHPRGYHSSLPLLQDATRVGSAQSRTPRLQKWVVDDRILFLGSRPVRLKSYALPGSETIELEVDGSHVQCDRNFPFTWADVAAWPPETCLSADGRVFSGI